MPDKEEKEPELPLQEAALPRYRLQEAEVVHDRDETYVMINGQIVRQDLPIGTLGYDM